MSASTAEYLTIASSSVFSSARYRRRVFPWQRPVLLPAPARPREFAGCPPVSAHRPAAWVSSPAHRPPSRPQASSARSRRRSAPRSSRPVPARAVDSGPDQAAIFRGSRAGCCSASLGTASVASGSDTDTDVDLAGPVGFAGCRRYFDAA